MKRVGKLAFLIKYNEYKRRLTTRALEIKLRIYVWADISSLISLCPIATFFDRHRNSEHLSVPQPSAGRKQPYLYIIPQCARKICGNFVQRLKFYQIAWDIELIKCAEVEMYILVYSIHIKLLHIMFKHVLKFSFIFIWCFFSHRNKIE